MTFAVLNGLAHDMPSEIDLLLVFQDLRDEVEYALQAAGIAHPDCPDCQGTGNMPTGWTAPTQSSPSEPTGEVVCTSCLDGE